MRLFGVLLKKRAQAPHLSLELIEYQSLLATTSANAFYGDLDTTYMPEPVWYYAKILVFRY
jgi:hypothetical protein